MGVVPIGSRRTAWWCTANEPEFVNDGPEGAKSKLLRFVDNWHQPIPDLIRGTGPATVIKTGMYDRRPVKKWSRGRVTLLGDAAHPTTPNMGQGGCMAIEDAVVFARALSNHSEPVKAFHVYERLRYARTARITNISRYYGVMGQWKNPAAAWARNALLRLVSGKSAAKGYLKFVGYDPYKIPVDEI